MFKFNLESVDTYENGKTEELKVSLDVSNPDLKTFFRDYTEDALMSIRVYSKSHFFAKQPFDGEYYLAGKNNLPWDVIVKNTIVDNNKVLLVIDLTYAGRDGYIPFMCSGDEPEFYVNIKSNKFNSIVNNKLARAGLVSDINEDMTLFIKLIENNYESVDGETPHQIVDKLIDDMKVFKKYL